MAQHIQIRRGLAATWTAENPLLAEGELGVELDTNKWKIGDGVLNWNARPYAPQGIQGVPGPPGAQGTSGTPGPAGSQGDQGDKGDQGDAGPTGPAGADGAPGPPGVQGPEGPEGPQGDTGAAGPAGDTGPTGPQGPAGGGPAPSSANPIADGTAAPGIATPYSREDHVHPTDTTLAPKSGAVLTNATAASTPAAADNSLKLSTTQYADRAASNAASGVAIPAASSANPLVNGTAAPGTAAPYSRQDHVHPIDTTRAPLAKRITSITSSATPAVNVAATDVVTITAQAVAITSMSSGLSGSATPEQMMMWRIHATGAFAITWGASFMSDGVVALPPTTVANKTIRVGTVWDEVAAKWVAIAASVVGY